MQAELRDTYPLLNISIIGVNEVGHEVSNDLVTANRTTPWLQDADSDGNDDSDVWYDLWNVTYRDVIIVDGQNAMVDVYNLTSNDLGVATNYATLRDKLIDAAMTEQKPWQNPGNRFDINDDGFVVPLDVLLMINEINSTGPLDLPPPTGTSLAAPFWDSNGDNFFSPVDILQVINFIESSLPEGEASSEPRIGPDAATIPLSAPDSLASVENNPLEAEVTGSSPEANGASTSAALVIPRVESSSDDEFWADYWPDLPLSSSALAS